MTSVLNPVAPLIVYAASSLSSSILYIFSFVIAMKPETNLSSSILNGTQYISFSAGCIAESRTFFSVSGRSNINLIGLSPLQGYIRTGHIRFCCSVCVADCVSVTYRSMSIFLRLDGSSFLRLENLEDVSVDIVDEYASVLENMSVMLEKGLLRTKVTFPGGRVDVPGRGSRTCP